MSVVVIHDLEDPFDVLLLARHLLDLLATGDLEDILGSGTLHLSRTQRPVPSEEQLDDLVRPDDDYTCQVPHHRDSCSCRQDAAATDPRQLRLLEAAWREGPVPYLPCPKAGTHSRLTDCWMCWSDVQRGALDIDQVLRS